MYTDLSDFLFTENPNPMWIYDLSDLSVKQVNDAACDLYGYSKDEFLTLTIADLRPEDEIPKLLDSVSKSPDTFQNAGIWKHQKKSGELIFVRILSYPVIKDDHKYELIAAHDVTSEVQYQKELQLLLENSSDGIILADPDGQIHNSNKAARSMLGMSEQQLINRGCSGILADHETFKQYFPDNEQGTHFSGQLELIHANGSKIPVDMTASAYRNVQGQMRLSIIFRDVTKETKLKRLLDQAHEVGGIGVWELDLETDTLFWSEMTRKIFEVGPDYQPNLETGIRFYKEGTSRVIIEKAVKKGIEEGAPWDEELVIVTAEGNERWVRSIGEPEVDNGRCVRMYGILQNIHKHKVARYQMIEALEERNRILERITEAFFAVDENWIIIYWNAQAEQVLRLTREKVLGKNLWDVFPEAKSLDFYKHYTRAVEEQTAVSFEDYYPPFDIWFEVNAYPSSKGLSVFFRDITDRKRNEIQLQESLAEKETLLAEIHHRVKNNLAVVSGMMHLQALHEEDEASRHKLNNSISRIQTIGNIHELLYKSNSFSRLDLDENINKLVQEIASNYQPAIEVELHFDMQKTDLSINQAIPASLIINEVITNVFKHGFSGLGSGVLWISMNTSGEQVSIQVTDNGSGLPDDFKVGSNPNSLGLQLIEILTQQLDGTYRYETVAEKTIFTLSFDKETIVSTTKD